MTAPTAPTAYDVEVLRRPVPVPGQVDVDGVRAAFDGLRNAVPGRRTLLVGSCEPTASFTRRDALLPGYDAARRTALEHGYAPVLRHVGGHLAAYGPQCLVLHAWSADAEPARAVTRRFAVLGQAVADGLAALGVQDPRLGELPGEYCAGRWSVNAGGRHKLVGTGQRTSRHGWVYSAVVTVDGSHGLTDLLADCYRDLGLPFDPGTVGSVADHLPGITRHQVAEALVASLRRSLAREL
ncbi:hypothetical protein [Nocardioides aequoreus]|uniref:hypothetical protein n=1 Tax=Nocardioides aequoreus TaxID=397278 RepID=UPI00068B2912|nr:hypothetical protein [Nocardioides aequoreus]